MPEITIAALNLAELDSEFEPIRRDGAGRVRVLHAQYRTSWEEISERRTGATLTEPETLSDELRDTLARSDVIFGFLVPRNLPTLAPRLRWIATPATGIDQLRGTGVLESGVTITNVGNLFAGMIAEHVFLAMLHFARRVHLFEEQRRTKVWKMSRVQPLAGRTVGLVGVGGIGSAVALKAKAFEMQVLGVGRGDARGRQIAGVDRLLSRDQLPELLSLSDYLVLAVADTPETREMIGVTELAAMKSSAILINVARGTVIDEPALVTALREGRIAGAALDVFASEPLPAESPLWNLPNVWLTPHVAANVVGYMQRAIAQFRENVQRFCTGQKLVNQLDRTRGY